MTTIAYKDGVLAADSRETAGGKIEPTSTPKITRLKSGAVIGAAGSSEDCAILRAYAEKKNMPKLEDVIGLMIKPDGSIWRFERNTWIEIITPYYAVGSGSTPATVAMRLGLSAVEAVEIAKEFDVFSGGEVRSLELKKPKRAKRN